MSLWSGGWRIWQLYYDDLCNAVMVNYVSTSSIKGSGQLDGVKFIIICNVGSSVCAFHIQPSAVNFHLKCSLTKVQKLL